MIDASFANEFISHWIDSWNQHNLPKILSHYTEDFEMTTPMIQSVMGVESGTLKGKENVGKYWETALKKFPDLHFEMLYATYGVNAISVCYKSAMNKITIETFFLNGDKKVYQALATYS